MKHAKWIIILGCVMFGLLLTATAGASVWDNCTELTPGETAEAVIAQPNGYAYFSFVPSETGTYRFSSAADRYTCGFLYDAEGNLIAEAHPTSSDAYGSFHLFRKLTAGTQYYFGARYETYNTWDTGSFSVTLDVFSGLISFRTVNGPEVSIPPDGSALLEVLAECSDDTELTYEWHRKEYNYEIGFWYNEPVPDAVGNTCLVDHPTDSRLQYTCSVSDQFGHKQTVLFYIYVDNQLIAEAVGEQTIYVAPGETLTLEVTASCNSGEISYQWYEFPNGYEEEIPGATSPVLTTDPISAGYTRYRCVVTDEYHNQKEIYFQIYIDNQLTAQAVGSDTITVPAGEGVVMEVAADCLVGELSYQWYFNAGPGDYMVQIQGETGPQYRMDVVTKPGKYGCTVNDSYGGGQWVYFTLKVDNQLSVRPVGSSSVWAQTGSVVRLEVDAVCSVGGLTYQWSRLVGNSRQNISGATSPVFSLTAESGQSVYFCSVRDQYGTRAEVRFTIITGDNNTWGETTWRIENGHKLIISGNGSISDFYQYSQSAWLAFRDLITEVVIEDGVTAIGDYAFDHFSALTGVQIPDSVKRIGERAFNGCGSLPALFLPESVTSILPAAFAGCENLHLTLAPANHAYWMPEGDNFLITSDGYTLVEYVGHETSVTVPAPVRVIGASAFADCATPVSVTLPDGVTEIRYRAFESCENLTTVYLPATLTAIGSEAFFGCSSFTDVYYNGTEEEWTAGVSVQADNPELQQAVIHFGGPEIIASGTCGPNLTWTLDSTSLLTISGTGDMTDFGFRETPWIDYERTIERIQIREGVTGIGVYAFMSLYSLREISLPDSLTRIGPWSLNGCRSLTEITIPANVSEIGDNALDTCIGLTAIHVDPANAVYADVDGVLFDKNITRLITLPGGTAGKYVIPDTVTAIEHHAACWCQKLTAVEIPAGVTSIGEHAFQACSLLTEIVIPKGVTSLGEYTFSSCSRLTDITLPAGLTAIGRNVFANTALTDVWYAGTEASWNRIVIDAGNDPLLQATVHYNVLPFTRVLHLPEGLTVLGSEAFANVQKPEAVILPDSLIAIAEDAIDPDVVLVISADSEWFTWAEAHGYTVYPR